MSAFGHYHSFTILILEALRGHFIFTTDGSVAGWHVYSTVSLLATVNSCRYICGFFSCECWYEAIHVYEIVNKRRCNFLHCQIHVGTLCNFCVMFCLFLWYLALVNMFVSPVHTWTDFWLVHLLEEIFTYMDYVVQHACSVTELQSR